MKLLRDGILESILPQIGIIQNGLGDPNFILPALEKDPTLTATEAWDQIRRSLNDLIATAYLSNGAETILVSADFALGLRNSLKRFDETTPIDAPFEKIIFQFDRPILEAELLEIDSSSPFPSARDTVLGLVYGRVDNSHNSCAYFSSSNVNRSVWQTGADPRKWIYKDPTEAGLRNKDRITALAVGILVYLNCKNITLKKVSPSTKINRKRERKGKRPLPDYYVTFLDPKKYTRGGRMQKLHGMYRTCSPSLAILEGCQMVRPFGYHHTIGD